MVDKPFEWVDPGAEISIDCRRYRGNVFIESANYCTVPHIMISDEGNQIWTREFCWNFVPYPQDHNYGGWLTLPCSYGAVNVADSDDACAWEAASSSTSEQESIDTPLDEFDGGDIFVEGHGEPAICHDDVWEDGPDLDTTVKDAFETHDLVNYSPSSGDQIEENEDDLPPFDDWYQSIAQRTQSLTPN